MRNSRSQIYFIIKIIVTFKTSWLIPALAVRTCNFPQTIWALTNYTFCTNLPRVKEKQSVKFWGFQGLRNIFSNSRRFPRISNPDSQRGCALNNQSTQKICGNCSKLTNRISPRPMTCSSWPIFLFLSWKIRINFHSMNDN